MALANYEGQAFRDGEHWHDGCATTLPTGDSEWGQYFHACVGVGDVRAGVYKTSPYLAERDSDVWRISALNGRDEVDGHVVIGFTTPRVGTVVLVDPDGVTWTAVGAYDPYDNWCDEEAGQ